MFGYASYLWRCGNIYESKCEIKHKSGSHMFRDDGWHFALKEVCALRTGVLVLKKTTNTIHVKGLIAES